jgi:hypothetical protein
MRAAGADAHIRLVAFIGSVCEFAWQYVGLPPQWKLRIKLTFP